jgi:hypothetical protein
MQHKKLSWQEELDLRAHYLMCQGLTYKEAWQQLKREEMENFTAKSKKHKDFQIWTDLAMQAWNKTNYKTLGAFMDSPQGKDFVDNYKKQKE